MIKTRKTDEPRIPENGRESLYFSKAGVLNQINDQGVSTPVVSGGGGGGPTLPEEPPLTAGWYGSSALERSGGLPGVWSAKDLTGLVAPGSKAALVSFELSSVGDIAVGDITAHMRPANIEDGVDPTGVEIGFWSANAEHITNTRYFTSWVVLDSSLQFDLKITSTDDPTVTTWPIAMKVLMYV